MEQKSVRDTYDRENMRQVIKKKARGIRGSLSIKMNILIVLIILTVSALLIIISDGAYQRAVFKSSEKKMNGIEIPEEELAPYLAYFLLCVDTEEFLEARARSGASGPLSDPERDNRLSNWMNNQADAPEELGTENLLRSWLQVAMWGDEFWETYGLESLRMEVCKDRKTWQIYSRVVKDFESYTSGIDAFGMPEAYFPELSAEDKMFSGSVPALSLTALSEP